MSDPKEEVVVVPTRQLDRIEESIATLAALLETLVSGTEATADQARDGFRAYRKRMGASK
jgi:hypothetical protein